MLMRRYAAAITTEMLLRAYATADAFATLMPMLDALITPPLIDILLR